MTEIDIEQKRDAALRIAELLLDETTMPKPAAPAIPWHEHSAFEEIEEARWKIARARDALAGIAAMLESENSEKDEQMNLARQSDAGAVFAFFAEAMREPLDVVDTAANRLQIALRTGQP